MEIIFRGKNVEKETADYIDKFANPLKAAQRGMCHTLPSPILCNPRAVLCSLPFGLCVLQALWMM